MTVKIYIIFYSMYGHIEKMARAAKAGVDAIEGCEGVLFQVPETLPAEVLAKMYAPPKPDLPIADAHTMAQADGFIFGFPTRFGTMCSQMQSFFDSTGQLWCENALVGKPGTCFTSTGTQHGGAEVTSWTAITQLAQHGMIYMTTGSYFGNTPEGADMKSTDKVCAYSSYGAATIAGPDGRRQPSECELGFAKWQAGKMAVLATKLSA